jgi:hypothetical protein
VFEKKAVTMQKSSSSAKTATFYGVFSLALADGKESR